MKKMVFCIERSPHRYLIFTACPDVLIVNMSAPKPGKIIRLHYDRSKLPADVIARLRREAQPI